MPVIGVGVIGTGFGRYVHVPAFRKDPRCRIVGISSRDIRHAEEAARALGIPKAYGDWRRLIRDPDVQAVAIAVPARWQPEMVLEAAASRKHVFCEKPLAADVQDSRRAYEAAATSGIVHAVDFLFPEIDVWRKAKSLLTSGPLGPVRSLALSWRVETRAYKTDAPSWKRRREEGGGTLFNLVAHSFYYLEWLAGPISRLAARLTPSGRDDAQADLWLTFPSGVPGTVTVASNAASGTGHRLEINAENGTLLLENPTRDHARGFSLAVSADASTPVERFSSAPGTGGDDRIGPAAEIVRRFLDAIQAGGEVVPGLEHGHRVQVLLAAAVKAAETGVWQEIPA